MSARRPGKRSALPDRRAAAEMARVDVRRGIRWATAQDFWLLYGAVSALGLAFICWLAFTVGRDTGAMLAVGDTPWFTAGGAAVLWSAVWLFTFALFVGDALSTNGDVPHDGHYLTIRPTADVAGGKVLAAAAKFAVFVFAPVLAWYGGMTVGSGALEPQVGGLAAAAVTIASASALAYPVGLALKGWIRRSAALTRLKPLLGAAVGVAYVVVMVTGEFTTLIETLRPVLRAPPLGWLADLSLATTSGVAAPAAGVAAALLAGVVTTVAGTLLAVPAGRYAWSADRARVNDNDGNTTAPDHGVDRTLAAVTRAPATSGVASTALLRTYRAPLGLVFAALPLLAAIPVGEQVLSSGRVPWYAPWFAVWYGAWAAGAALPLNPLGSQGAALPALLTSPADPRNVVHGYVVAAALPAVPVTVVAAAGLAAASGGPTVEIAGVAAAAVGAVLAACVLAAGVGSVFPRFETVDFSGSRTAVPPSKVAFAAFATTLTVAVVAVAVLVDSLARTAVAVLLSEALPFGLVVDAALLRPVAWVVLTAVALAVPVAYRVAVARVQRYRLS